MANLLQRLGFLVRPLFANATYTVHWGLAKGLKRKGGLQFIPQITPLRAEERFLQSYDFNGKTVYDIGGFEGIFTLFFARAVGPNGKVVTFEPNPANHARILENVGMNGFDNVTAVNLALGKDASTARLVFNKNLREAGSLRTEIGEPLLRSGKETSSIEVMVEPLDRYAKAHGLPLPHFIKIDVEGYENDVLAGMQALIERHSPAFFIENHAFRLPGPAAKTYLEDMVSFFSERGFTITHVEDNSEVTTVNALSFSNGHFYCVMSRSKTAQNPSPALH